MVWLLACSLALADEPLTFSPVAADVVVEGDTLRGILIDEATYVELGALRVKTQVLEKEIEAFEEWQADHTQTFGMTVTALKVEHEAGQQRLIDHYEEALTKAKRKDALQRHGFTLGVAVGVVATTVLTVVVLNIYDNALPASLTGS